jgi:hypothetical protein
MARIKVGDINMYCDEPGEDEPLVFINGGGVTVKVMRQ